MTAAWLALTENDIQAATAGLRATLAEIEAGRLVCSAATRHRIEGAVLALKTTTRIGNPDEAYLASACQADAPPTGGGTPG